MEVPTSTVSASTFFARPAIWYRSLNSTGCHLSGTR